MQYLFSSDLFLCVAVIAAKARGKRAYKSFMHYASLLYTRLIFLSILSFILHQPIVCRTVIHCKERKKINGKPNGILYRKGFQLGRALKTESGIRDDTSLRARYGIMVEAGPFRSL